MRNITDPVQCGQFLYSRLRVAQSQDTHLHRPTGPQEKKQLGREGRGSLESVRRVEIIWGSHLNVFAKKTNLLI